MKSLRRAGVLVIIQFTIPQCETCTGGELDGALGLPTRLEEGAKVGV